MRNLQPFRIDNSWIFNNAVMNDRSITNECFDKVSETEIKTVEMMVLMPNLGPRIKVPMINNGISMQIA